MIFKVLSNSNHSVIVWMQGCASLTLNVSWNISPATMLSKLGLGRVFIYLQGYSVLDQFPN